MMIVEEGRGVDPRQGMQSSRHSIAAEAKQRPTPIHAEKTAWVSKKMPTATS